MFWVIFDEDLKVSDMKVKKWLKLYLSWKMSSIIYPVLYRRNTNTVFIKSGLLKCDDLVELQTLLGIFKIKTERCLRVYKVLLNSEENLRRKHDSRWKMLNCFKADRFFLVKVWNSQQKDGKSYLNKLFFTMILQSIWFFTPFQSWGRVDGWKCWCFVVLFRKGGSQQNRTQSGRTQLLCLSDTFSSFDLWLAVWKVFVCGAFPAEQRKGLTSSGHTESCCVVVRLSPTSRSSWSREERPARCGWESVWFVSVLVELRTQGYVTQPVTAAAISQVRPQIVLIKTCRLHGDETSASVCSSAPPLWTNPNASPGRPPPRAKKKKQMQICQRCVWKHEGDVVCRISSSLMTSSLSKVGFHDLPQEFTDYSGLDSSRFFQR